VIPPTTPADIDKLIKGRDQQRENNAHANFQHTIPDITLFDSLKAGAIH
jgi:hypothetical protein